MEAFEKKFPEYSEETQKSAAQWALERFYTKQIARKEGWRAALEWIYIEATGTDLSTMRDMINKELEDK